MDFRSGEIPSQGKTPECAVDPNGGVWGRTEGAEGALFGISGRGGLQISL